MTLIGLFTGHIALKFGLWSAVYVYIGLTAVLVGILAIFHPLTAFLVVASAVTLGPLCGPVWLLVIGARRRTAQPPPEPVLKGPTRAERIAQEIVEGRRPVGRDRIAPSFIEVFASGSLHEQQSALAAIARHFTPELRPALEGAQVSEIPAIRAQSTAVLTQLRDSYTNRAREILSNTTGLGPDALAAEVETISRSGFVGPQMVSDLRRIAQKAYVPSRNMALT